MEKQGTRLDVSAFDVAIFDIAAITRPCGICNRLLALNTTQKCDA